MALESLERKVVKENVGVWSGEHLVGVRSGERLYENVGVWSGEPERPTLETAL